MGDLNNMEECEVSTRTAIVAAVVVVCSLVVKGLSDYNGVLYPWNAAAYVVSGKGAQKIEYYSIANPSDKHVMTFDKEGLNKESSWYPYINVGDTIVGRSCFMNMPVCNSLQTARYGGSPVIKTLNGRGFKYAYDCAVRDSLAREIKAKQR